MSRPVQTYLSCFFGSKRCSDCHIRFQITALDSSLDSAPRYIGEPWPAHQVVLRGGSERFRAQLERWTPQALSGGSNASRTVKRRRMDAQPSEPMLAVLLDSDDELEPTLAAIRFMYTGNVAQPEEEHAAQDGQQQGASHGGDDTRGDNSIRALLLIRRQAEYLQVQVCAEACDAALADRFAEADEDEESEEDSDTDSDDDSHTVFLNDDSSDGSDVGGTNGRGGFVGRIRSTPCGGGSGPVAPLAPILELYSCRQLLPSPEDDPRVVPVLYACCKRLSRHWDKELAAVAGSLVALSQPTKFELLVWLLGSTDAVRIASDPALRLRWLELPVGALEMLLQSDHLSTDDEGTVVVLVEMWVVAKGRRVTEADKARVRRQLRLVNCSPSYLLDVLPKLPLMGPEQVEFLICCRLTDRSEWKAVGRQMGGYDMSSPWYGKPRPQSVPAKGLSFKWEISRADLLDELTEYWHVKEVYATFKHVRSSTV